MSLDRGVQRIRSVRVQGATNVAVYALKLFIQESQSLSEKDYFRQLGVVKDKLGVARPNEPMLRNVLELFYKSVQNSLSVKENKGNLLGFQKNFLERFESDFRNLAVNGSKLVKSGDVVFTHCHSSSVMRVLREACKEKEFRVVCTETRPLFQGRKTAKELVRAGIRTKMVVDSHMLNEIRDCDKIFLGADVLSGAGFLNKIGSYNAAYAAKHFRKPLYVCAHTLKYSPEILSIEKRNPDEVWRNPPEGLEVENYSFELVPWVFVNRVVSERGVMKYGDLL